MRKLKIILKKIIIDDSSIQRKLFDISLNPLIQNVPNFKGQRVGYKYLILDIYKKINFKIKNEYRSIFFFLEGLIIKI